MTAQQLPLTKRAQVEIIGVGGVDAVIIGPDVMSDNWVGAAAERPVCSLEAASARIRGVTLARPGGVGIVVENKCGDLVIEGCAIHGGATGLTLCSSTPVRSS